MKRKTLLFLVMALIIISSMITGCGNGKYDISNGEITTGEGLIQGDYESFDGNYYETEKLAEGNRITFGYAAGTVSGEISAQLVNPNGEIEVVIEDRLTYEIKDAGKYKIEVIGVQHSGAFALEWTVE
ncbi:hypothetical protein SAMN02745751_00633 [Dethiosulfatibacter aminovorans DSM 17477]|uniref:Lipoprotein n=1 Tax=Dethiosulfatibacter aminovorans DSM 17477 TaxID=1121476 RepID=A0A1M6CAC0_9FIRM|nr:hypothetical protein [Dethiosulfatibacter aminovorans]SHI57741.1 hypothetical protein SAMN02745751_00633 [Dethiosulfatibacter aminovorans DSM 17477]